MAETEMPFQWNVDTEVGLFHAMRGHKPVGVNRHFQMICIQEKLNNSCNRKISVKHIWDHLSQMFDLQALNESEIVPFPNKELDFGLPDADFSDWMNENFPRIANEKLKFEENKQENKAEHRETNTGLKETNTGSVKLSKSEKNEKYSNTHSTPGNSDNSPKRKRTRQTQSSNSQTPTDSAASKRRR